MRRAFPAALFLAAAPAVAAAHPAPDLLRKMVEAALATGDPQTIDAVIATALKVDPDSASDIQAMRAAYDSRRSKLRSPAASPSGDVAGAAAPKPLKAEIELGGNRTTGSSDTLGLSGRLKLIIPDRRWTQELDLRMDYQRDSGVTTVEHASATYKPRLDLRQDLYAYGLAQYEHDRPLGYGSRDAVGVGMGWRYAPSDHAKILIDAGPSFRRTEYYEFGNRNRFAARASVEANWRLAANLTLSSEETFYFERGNTSASSTTALDTRLFGPLKARLSYNVEYESDAPGRQRKLDTISRASLVYSR
jgi:putative salt-induced outer membrane protein